MLPALSGAMDRRIRILNASVELMEKLQARISRADVDLMPMPDAVDLLKAMSHQFTEVLEACRRCSTDELVGRLDNLHLYQLISNMSPMEKDQLRATLTSRQDARVTVVEPVDVVPVSSPPVTEEGACGQPASSL